MQFSLALLAASISTAAAWNVTGFTDSKCTEPSGYSWGYDKSIGCLGMSKPVTAIRVEHLPDDMVFTGSSGYSCNNFHTRGGNGCHTQGQKFQSFSVYKKPAKDA
ncbi:hypothetical protein N7512_008481 [Penicillium capsulatum]|nr:hypothetical protein N7512_008481 [Penicillium capsulatum]